MLICTLGAVAGIFMIPLNPVNSKVLKLAFLGCVVASWIGFAILTWNRKFLKVLMLALPLLAVTPFMLPAGNIDEDELRQDYVRRMGGFEGTKYF